ncbi:MAG TPA: ADP-glyceromanno-heptose 6-epimerase [Fibrobacteres bacterium]|jgi:ADP-L-glycero-D-manno-heptose 6-epimerase|nr:ADP-glyceromanno-heptose 6-epimerase [Fibrobacterota bacterium]
MPSSPCYVITGAAGFIGSALAYRLNQLGRDNLILVDGLGTDTRWKNLVPLRYADYYDRKDFLEALLAGKLDHLHIKAIFHLGACSSTTEADAGFLLKNNFEYTKLLAQWCGRHKTPIRFIYASSAATYGDGSLGYSDDHALIPRLRPLNGYGYSKHLFDLWALRHDAFDYAVGLKYFNVYGPNEYHKDDMKSMVAKAHTQIHEAGSVKLFKSYRPDYRDGEQKRDFLHVMDAVDMTLFFLNPKIAGGIYNVGTGQSRTWIDMMNAVFSAMGREPRIDFIPMPEVIRDKYQYFTEAEMGKIRKAGYRKPIQSLEEGVSAYVPYLEMGQQILGWN